MKTKQLLLIICLMMSNIVLARELVDKGISLTKKGNDYVIEFELIDYKTITTKIKKSNTETEDFIRIDIPEYGIIYEEGAPQLPQISFSLAIPYDMEKPNFEVSAVAENKIKLDHRIYPTQYDIPDTLSKEKKIKINDSIYSGKKKFELPFATLSDPFIVSGVKGVMVTIYPFQYDPVKNSLIIRKKGTVKIKIGKEIDTKVVETESTTDYLNDFFINYGDCHNLWSNYTAKTDATTMLRSSSQYPKGNYLLIYPTTYYLGFGLNRFIEHKKSLGYNVSTVGYAGCVYTWEGDCVSLTTPTEIKNIIKSAYNNPSTRPEYVLLVGDYADVGGWVFPLSGEDDTYSDLSYSLLEGNDNYADVGFGRWPVTNPTELNNIINKTIEMENKFRASSISQKRATLIADWDDDFFEGVFGITFENCIPETRTSLQIDGYTCTTILKNSGGTTNDIVSQINNGSYFVYYRGHGGKRHWAGPEFQDTLVKHLTNSIYPIIISNACHTGNFIHWKTALWSARTDSEDFPYLGEKFLRGTSGACFFWGATRKTDRLVNNRLNEYMFFSPWTTGSDRFNSFDNMSKITNASIKRLTENFSLIPSQTNKLIATAAYNILGDPSLQIRFKECPTDLTFWGGETDSGETLQYPITKTISVGGNSTPFNYTVRSGGNLTLRANNSIILKPGFSAQAGSKFSASITSTACSTLRSAYQRNVYQTDYGTEDEVVLLDNSNEIISFETADVQVYPNPFNEFVTVSFYCYEQTTISLKLYDIQGKLLKFAADRITYPEGKNEINIEGDSLEKGIYLLKLTVNNLDFVYKLIKN